MSKTERGGPTWTQARSQTRSLTHTLSLSLSPSLLSLPLSFLSLSLSLSFSLSPSHSLFSPSLSSLSLSPSLPLSPSLAISLSRYLALALSLSLSLSLLGSQLQQRYDLDKAAELVDFRALQDSLAVVGVERGADGQPHIRTTSGFVFSAGAFVVLQQYTHHNFILF